MRKEANLLPQPAAPEWIEYDLPSSSLGAFKVDSLLEKFLPKSYDKYL